jgi:hypothetical protein
MNSAEHQPAISVVMPVYNAASYLAEAVTSVLQQDFRSFELLICDDGSLDDSPIIASAFTKDRRVRLIRNELNLGLIETLHKAYSLCRADFIARMDADDVCDLQRFGRQLKFLRCNPHTAIVGGAIRFFGNGTPFVFNFPTSHAAIKAGMLFFSPLAHPAIMFRRELVQANLFQYSDKFRHAEDYHLWSHLLSRVQVANLPDVVLNYRLHSAQVSSAQAEEQYQAALRVRRSLLENCGLQPTEAEIALHETLVLGRPSSGRDYLEQVACWLARLEDANTTSKYLDCSALHDLLTSKFREAIQRLGVDADKMRCSKNTRRYCSLEEKRDFPGTLSQHLQAAIKRLTCRKWRRAT